MSRTGKKPIALPQNTEVNVSGAIVTVKGPKGTLEREFDRNIQVTVSPEEVNIAPLKETADSAVMWGTYVSHFRNMLQGVTSGFEKKLIVEGIGFKAEVRGTNLVLSLGFSHQITVAIPDGLKVTSEKNIISISGINKDLVGSFASKIRALKVPEPYKGKGIRYDNEVVRRKQGKKTA